MKLFRNESGFALPLALLVLVTTSAILATAIATTSSTGRTANLGKTAVSAQALAEAGLANGVAILAKPAADMNDPELFPHTLATAITYTIDGGTAKVWGVYDTTDKFWTLTALGSLPNPTGGAPITKTVTRTVQVKGVARGATVPEWSRFIHDDASSCFTIDTVTIPGAVASRGPMCLVNSGNVAVNSTGAATTVGVGTTLNTQAPITTSPVRSPVTSAGSGWAPTAPTLNTNLTTSNSVYATDSIPTATPLSANLDTTGFFSPVAMRIPTTATIRGIQVTIVRKADATANGGLRDEDVFLLKAGAPIALDRAFGTDWPTVNTTVNYPSTTPDLWSTTWTPAQINATNFGVRLRVRNRNTGGLARIASVDSIRVTVTYSPVPPAAIGSPASPILRADIGGTCTLNGNAAGACNAASAVWATTVGGAPSLLVKPQIDLDWWWRNAKPGPKHPCTEPGNTFPNGFDNDSASTTTPNNSNPGIPEITPMGSSYTCQVKENGVLKGEISWNNATHVLTVYGTIYVDGDIRFDDNGQIVHYQGRAIIYASDDTEFDERVCAGGSGMTDCAASAATMAAWDPSANLLTILAGNISTSQPCCPLQENAEFDHSTQGSDSSQGDDPLAPGAFQGIVYAAGNCQVHEQFLLSGPVICNRISISDGAETTFPLFSAFPPLGSLVDGSIYLNPDNADTFEMELGPQTG